MNAAGALGDSDIETIVDEDARRSAAAVCAFRGALHGFACKRGVFSSGQIFFADLDPVDRGRGFHNAKQWLIRARNGWVTHCAPIRDVAKDRAIERTIAEGHAQE